MTTVKRPAAGDGVERPTRLADGRRTQGDVESTGPNPWYRRVSFWRSVAGMAVAIALGCAAVALETASELSSHSTFFHRRLELLHSRISELRTEADDAERHLAAMRAEQATRTKLDSLLSADDVVVLRLRPGPGSSARGIVAASRQVGSAIIEVAGLPAGAHQTYVMWWLSSQGSPRKAGELSPNADGRLSLAVQMPPRSAKIAGVIVTLEAGKAVARPYGKRMLKGELPTPEILG
jgi:hypothetical protein